MAALSFTPNNWPTTFHQHHHDINGLPPPSFLPFHDIDHPLSTFTNSNNLPFHNSINFPTLSCDNPLASLPSTIAHQQYYYYANPPFVCDHHDYFFPMNDDPIEQTQPDEYNSYHSLMSYDSYPLVHDMFPMEQMQHGVYDLGNACHNVLIDQDVQTEEPDDIGKGKGKGNGNGDGDGDGNRRLSAQSMAARVRRRKISGKTLELGKLVPGGHRMTTAEMFQAAYKYIRFLQVQVGVLQLMSSSTELGEELQATVTSPSVQEKLYTAEKCIVSQTLAKTLTSYHEE